MEDIKLEETQDKAALRRGYVFTGLASFVVIIITYLILIVIFGFKKFQLIWSSDQFTIFILFSVFLYYMTLFFMNDLMFSKQEKKGNFNRILFKEKKSYYAGMYSINYTSGLIPLQKKLKSYPVKFLFIVIMLSIFIFKS